MAYETELITKALEAAYTGALYSTHIGAVSLERFANMAPELLAYLGL